MRANLLVVLLVLLAGIGLSLLLIPRGGELALQSFRDQDFAPAQAAYQARFDAGDRSADTVMPLTRLYLMEGSVERAIALMEAYVAREPNQLAGRELLGTLYQHAQRTADYLDNLEAIARLKPSEDVFRELANTYGFHGDFDHQVEALKRLVALRPDDFAAVVDLAQLLAARGRLAEAAEALAAADDRAKGNIEYDGRVLLTSLLHDLDRTDEAFRRAERWLAGDPPTYAILSLTGLMMEMNRPDHAYRLLSPFAERARREPPLELTLIDLEIAQGRVEEAQRQLRDWPARKPVDDASLGRFVALAINAGLPRLALEQARGRDPHLIPDWAVVGLVETAFRERDLAFLDGLIGALGDAFLVERPVLAAEIAMARGDRVGAARWAGDAVRDPKLTLPEHLSAVRLLARADGREAAVAAFDQLAPDVRASDDVLEELGLLYLDLDRAARGLAWFEARRKARPSAAADLGWVRLAARAGDSGAVAAWLDAHPTLDPALLQDVAAAAVERGAVPLALKAAERVYAQAPTPRSRLALASAQLAAGHPKEALGHLRTLLGTGGAEVEGLYLAALAGAGETEELARVVGARLASDTVSAAEKDQLVQLLIEQRAYRAALPHLRERAATRGLEWLYAYADAAMKVGAGQELAAFLRTALERPGLDAKTRDAMAYALIDAAGPAGALPTLKTLADAAPSGPWEALYRETLTKLGRKDELRRHLQARAADDRLPAAERRALASALLEMGDKAAAEGLFRKLAAGQGTDGPDVRQLLFLWGPRPGAAALDWVEARARAATSPAERAAWYDKLAELGGAKRVAAALGPKAADGALRGSYIEALAAAGKRAELAEAVRAALPGERDPEKLRRYARLAERERQMPVSAAAWRALVELRPDDGEALRQVGMLAYGEARFADAERALGRFLAKGNGDYEANYFMGEALVSQKRPAEAEPFQRRALAQVQAMGNRSDAVRQTEANLLNRLGRIDESAALFDTLLAARPTDRQLRADYAAMLIENRRLKEARHVLGN